MQKTTLSQYPSFGSLHHCLSKKESEVCLCSALVGSISNLHFRSLLMRWAATYLVDTLARRLHLRLPRTSHGWSRLLFPPLFHLVCLGLPLLQSSGSIKPLQGGPPCLIPPKQGWTVSWRGITDRSLSTGYSCLLTGFPAMF